MVNAHATLTEGFGEGVVLLLGLLGPHHIVEKQLADVLGREPGKLQARAVDDGLAELPNLGVDMERHGRTSFLSGCWDRVDSGRLGRQVGRLGRLA